MPKLRDDAGGWAAINCAAALVTACLDEEPDRDVIEGLLQEAHAEGYLFDLTAALALGFATNIEAVATLTGTDAHVLWQRWCEQEAHAQSTARRPFRR